MNIFTRRVAWAYSAILIGAILFMLRRLLLPTTFEIEGVPFDIAVASVANSCYSRPALNSCSDPTIVLLTIVAVIALVGWGSLGRATFAAILAVLPLGLYLALAPIWLPLLLLLLIPLAMEWAIQLLFPAT